MSEEINKYLETKIANSLNAPAPGKFTDKLMREIELSKEFEKQDKKLSYSVRFIIVGFSLALTVFLFIFGYYLSKQLSNEESTLGREYSTLNLYINEFFTNSLSLFGISISTDVVLYGAVILALIGIGTLIDRFVFRKSY